MLDGRARLEGRASFRTWVFAVVRRTAAAEWRRAALRWLVPLRALDGTAATGGDPGVALVRSETSRELLVALALLPRRQREVLHLVFYQDLTIAEAAEVLGVSLGTARTHYDRGKTTPPTHLHASPACPTP